MIAAATNHARPTHSIPHGARIPTPRAPPPSPTSQHSRAGSSEPRRSMVEVHVSNGNFEQAKVYAHVELEHPVHSPFLFIRAAMELCYGAPCFNMVVGPRGVGVMVFDTLETRERIVGMSPILHDDNAITLEKHEEADDRFISDYSIYAEIAAVGFPFEHWEEEFVVPVLAAIGNVCYLDPKCKEKVDLTTMRVVVRLNHASEIPDRLLVRNHSGPASLPFIYPIRIWSETGSLITISLTTRSPAFPSLVADEDAAEAADALHLLSIGDTGSNPGQHDLGEPVPPGAPSAVFTFGAGTDEEHESSAHKRRARRKRAVDCTRKLRRSTRLAEKERSDFEDPSDRASRVQAARVDFSGASRLL
ncbi:uncharacterized protein [Miscanthus floridulus]|uniref:uncharacterized protein n=1 Tax=Miscanthus floridulus TaxID=154761 RepID=UPI003458E58C